jgi:hypothetical protein
MLRDFRHWPIGRIRLDSEWRQVLSNQHHEQDIRHVIVEQEAKADTAGRYRSGGCDLPREAYATLVLTGAYTRRIPAQPPSKSR